MSFSLCEQTCCSCDILIWILLLRRLLCWLEIKRLRHKVGLERPLFGMLLETDASVLRTNLKRNSYALRFAANFHILVLHIHACEAFKTRPARAISKAYAQRRLLVLTSFKGQKYLQSMSRIAKVFEPKPQRRARIPFLPGDSPEIHTETYSHAIHGALRTSTTLASI